MEPRNTPEAAEPAPQAAKHPRRRTPGVWFQRIRGWYILLARTMHRTVIAVLAHDCLNLAQSTAYSAIVALFPTLIVAAAVIGLLPYTTPLRFQLALFFDRILPPGVSPLLDAYFQNSPTNTHSIRALVGAGIVSFLGASNVVYTIMEGLRRAANLPLHSWSFWQRRRRALELVPLSMIPLAIASLLVVFGHSVTVWLAPNISPHVRGSVYFVALLIRWSVALGASVGLIALIYHLGVPGPLALRRAAPKPQTSEIVAANEAGEAGVPMGQIGILTPGAWIPTLPGAVVATAMWFLTTLAFGWYVTRFANYSEVYGSLGAGIALLFWLYIISLSVLSGAEFNAQLHAHVSAQNRREQAKAEISV